VAALLSALSARDDVRVSAILLNEGRLADEARRCEIEVCVLPEAEYGFFRILSAAARFLRRQNIQILHSHRYKENFLATLLARSCHVATLVRTQHGAPEPFAGWHRAKQNAIGIVDRFVARYFTDSVISVSDELRAGIGRYVPADRLVVIRNAIDTRTVRSALSVAEAKSRLGIPAGCPVVGAAGRLEPIKRIDLFLQAAREIAWKLPEAKFVIAGAGSEELRLRRLADELELGDRAIFLGHRDDVYDVLRAMDLLVLTSDHEGLPTSLLEALFLQITVVARPVGGITEVIENGVTGFLAGSAEPAALAQVCVSVLADEKLRRQVAGEGARVVERQFSIGRAARQMAGLYRRLGERP